MCVATVRERERWLVRRRYIVRGQCPWEGEMVSETLIRSWHFWYYLFCVRWLQTRLQNRKVWDFVSVDSTVVHPTPSHWVSAKWTEWINPVMHRCFHVMRTTREMSNEFTEAPTDYEQLPMWFEYMKFYHQMIWDQVENRKKGAQLQQCFKTL